MKTFLKIIKILLLSIVVLVAGIIGYALLTYKKTFHAAFPEIAVSADSTLIARGKYLVYGPAHCANCHAPLSAMASVDAGEEVHLSGGMNFHLPLGDLYTANISSDKETGIGRLTDGEIARALRYGIRHDGQAIIDLMPFYDISDYDLTAIVSWLRTQAPVSNKVPENSYTFLGKMIKAYVLKPTGDGDVPKAPAVDSTAAYGKYLVHSVANCRGCHSMRDLMTGAYIGPELAGGMQFEVFDGSGGIVPGKHLVTPNLTSEPNTGVIANWTQQHFIDRFKAGRVIQGSPMPWGPFSRMSELELTAIYKYLHSLEPVFLESPIGIQEGDPEI